MAKDNQKNRQREAIDAVVKRLDDLVINLSDIMSDIEELREDLEQAKVEPVIDWKAATRRMEAEYEAEKARGF